MLCSCWSQIELCCTTHLVYAAYFPPYFLKIDQIFSTVIFHSLWLIYVILLFELFSRLIYFFKNLFFYFRKYDPLRKAFAHSFVIIGYLLLFALFLRLIHFFLNLILYFRKHDPLRKVFTLSFLMIGIFFIPIFSHSPYV